ncbi:MAG TPA: shikimate dehydrogenase [Candidatus Ozemobacteraceae bacterium]|jgi:shikimate dehydrogenase
MDITPHTRLYGLLGDPVDHSLSPAIWNAAFRADGTNAVYLALRVSPSNLEAALRGLQAVGAAGLNVTRPHKESAFRLCTSPRGAAVAIRAVNTLWFPDSGGIAGANTDAEGFLELLNMLPRPSQAVLLGAGGAALAVLWSLCQRETPVVYWANRSRDRLKTPFPTGTTRIIPTSWEESPLSDVLRRADMIVNATSLGWHPDDRLDALNELNGARTVYIDMNYAPSSRLLHAARTAGARVVDGTELLIRQGVAAYALLTGRPAPEGAMRQAVATLIRA